MVDGQGPARPGLTDRVGARFIIVPARRQDRLLQFAGTLASECKPLKPARREFYEMAKPDNFESDGVGRESGR